MADSRNFVRIEGYLKENTLEVKRNKDTHQEIISGALTIMVSADEEYRIWYYANRYKKLQPGEATPRENRIYEDLAKLLPDKTTSLAQVIQADPSATLENSKGTLTKIACTAKFEERFYKDRNGAVRTQYDVRGVSAFTANKDFNPHSYYEIEGYIQSIKNELDADQNETGRVIVDIVLLDFTGRAHKIPFVSGGADIAAVLADFELNSTYTLRGHLSRLVKRTTVVDNSAGSFGDKPREQTVTQFIDERVITGGNNIPLAGDKAISMDSVKSGMVARNEEIERVESQTSSAKTAAGSASSAASTNAAATKPATKPNGSFGAASTTSEPLRRPSYEDVEF